MFGIYRRVLGRHVPDAGRSLSHHLTVYLVIVSICGVCLYFLKIRKLPIIANQVLCLSVASILLPPLSFDYTLIHLYIAWGMLALFAQKQWMKERETVGLTSAFICLAILMSPESELILNGIRFGGQIKAVTLGGLMYIGLRYPFIEGEKAVAAQ